MPAIQLERLRKQVAELIEWYKMPAKFAFALEDLFVFYADRTQHRNTAKARSLVIKSYRVPKPVQSRILQEIKTNIVKDPEAAIPLVDELWGYEVLEYRTLAVSILSQLPPDLFPQVIERIKAWNRENNEDMVLELLADQAPVGVKSHSVEDFIGLVKELIGSDHFIEKRLGVRMLLPLVCDSSFENLPAVFNLLMPLIEEIPADLRPDILDLLRTLVERTPQETALFLRQNSKQCKNKQHFSWLVRRIIPHFPPEIQKNLSATLH